MKKFLLTVVGILFAATSFAQNSLVASLTSGENTTYYYGGTALKQAVADAVSGDIISLSGGIFQAINIGKAISLRGTGIASDNPTIISGEFTINIPSDDAKQFTMEGIKCQNIVYLQGTFSNPYFLKSQIQRISGYDYSDAITNIMVVNCKVLEGIGVKGNSSAYLVNSYCGISERSDNASITATNCVLQTYLGNHRSDIVRFYNCIFYAPGYSEAGIAETGQATNCISTFVNIGNYASNIFHGGCINCTHGVEKVFKDLDTFELNDDIKANFKGTDGKEVGLYGGLMPYNTTPTYPLITKMDVDEKTDADGQLGVTIEVK